MLLRSGLTTVALDFNTSNMGAWLRRINAGFRQRLNSVKYGSGQSLLLMIAALLVMHRRRKFVSGRQISDYVCWPDILIDT